MATDPKTIININQDPSYGPQDTTYLPSVPRDEPVVQTVTIQYTNPPLYGVPELQIFNDPGGNSNGVVQFNASNRFGADNNFRWDSKNRTLNILGNIKLTGDIQGRMITSTSKLKIYGGAANNILTTDGSGNLRWSNLDGISYGNTEVANFLPTYTGDFKNSSIIEISNVAPNADISGRVWFNTDEGRSYVSYQNAWVDSSPMLSPDPDLTANTITFPDATIQSTAWTGNVAAANVTGLGDIATIALDGNVSNVLTGFGSFVALPTIDANTVVWTTAPVANNSTGTAGQVAYDAGGNLYVCVATDTWAKFTGSTSW